MIGALVDVCLLVSSHAVPKSPLRIEVFRRVRP